MKRPVVIWLIFATCVVGITGVLGWLTHLAVQSVHDEQRRELTASSERLALWRIDSALMPLIIQESARQHMLYVGEQVVADGRAGQNFGGQQQTLQNDNAENGPGQAGLPQQAARRGPQQVGTQQAGTQQAGPEQAAPQQAFNPPQGRAQPQQPDSQSEQVRANYVLPSVAPASRIGEAATPFVQLYFSSAASGMKMTSNTLNPHNRDPVNQLWHNLTTTVTNDDFLIELPPSDEDTVEVVALVNAFPDSVPSKPGKGTSQNNWPRNRQQNSGKDSGDLSQRQINVGNSIRQFVDYNTKDNDQIKLPSHVQMGPLSSFWKGEMLILARRLRVQGEEQVQGCLLDWRGIRPWLLDQIEDILPQAQLEPAVNFDDDDGHRSLASLPVVLVTGELPFQPRIDNRLWATLAFAWGWLALASVTVGVLLFAVMRLSERRAAFVSAVTHELRTPLTTFQLYTDLLASEQGSDGVKRQRYVNTLQKESHRLSHLIENVLAHSQMEQASLGLSISEIDTLRVLEDVIPRLEQRCDRTGVKLKTKLPDDSTPFIRGEHAGVERILVNLIDNACKYGVHENRPPSVELSLETHGNRVELRVRDNGPGISSQMMSRLFRPFSKSAHDAAISAPGVGLGLSLSRRIAKTMQGDLEVESTGEDGTVFLLWFPKI
jgi:signal transduction histidine kinase